MSRPPRRLVSTRPGTRSSLQLVGAALLVGALGALAGCAGGAAAPLAPDDGTDRSIRGTVTVFAAASLTDTFEELEARLEAQHPELDIVIVLAGSATLVQQLIAGAPADVFASADRETMELALNAGSVETPVSFARNPLALAVPAGNPGAVKGLDDLARDDLLIALCASEVPCGRAADALLAARGVSPSVDTRESDVRAVLTKIRLGEVDAGIVYATDVRVAGDAVEAIEWGADDLQRFAPTYQIAIVNGTPRRGAAEAWISLVLSDEGRTVLDDAGFVTDGLSPDTRGEQP